MTKLLPLLLIIFGHFWTDGLAYTWPNIAYDYVEEFLWLELTGFAAIPPVCGPTAANPDGTSPSIQAQWLRTVCPFRFSDEYQIYVSSRRITTWQHSMPELAD
jgi:hypothetical protein